MADTMLLNVLTGDLTVIQVQGRCDARQHLVSVWQWEMLQSLEKSQAFSRCCFFFIKVFLAAAQ